MFVKKILVHNFRNYKFEEVSFCPRVNLFYGQNAQGKTNLAEAVYFALQGQSYRTRYIKNIIHGGCEKMGVAVDFFDGSYDSQLRMVISSGNKRKVTMDENPLEKGVSHAGLFNVVSVCPDDVGLIKEGPSGRRAFLDGILIKVDSLYHSLLRDYKASLDNRNKLLNTGRRGREFDAWNESFLKLGEQIEKSRLALIEKITPVVRLMHRKIAHSNEELQIDYSFKGSDKGLRESFAQLHSKERVIGRTLIGPHLDDLVLKINNAPIKTDGSEGQIRTALFALKIGQARMVKFFTRKNPVFIFDDVLLELDEGRKKAVFSEIRDEYQVFVTSTRKDVVEGLRKDDTVMYRVENGKVFSEKR